MQTEERTFTGGQRSGLTEQCNHAFIVQRQKGNRAGTDSQLVVRNISVCILSPLFEEGKGAFA